MKLLAFSLLLLCQSCALMLTGTTDTIQVTSDRPQSVRVDGVATYQTPFAIELDSDRDHLVSVDGQTWRIKSSLDAAVLLDVVLLSPLHLVVDFVSGAAYSLSPRQLHVGGVSR